MRGWRAYDLGPGSLYDTLSGNYQTGDIRLQASIEYTLRISKLLNFVLFYDVGNVWMFRKDDDRPGANFSKDFYKEIGQDVGFGFHLDFDYFVIRFELGFPLYQPSMPEGERWVFTPKPIFDATYGRDQRLGLYNPAFQLGIGYAF